MSCFNYMVLLGELTSDQNITTSYQGFYASMIKVPYLGSSIPVLLPSLVVIFCIIFAILSIFKLKNKALSAFKKVGDAKDDSKKESDLLSLVESIVKGERAILAEYDLNKKREERNKLLRFNQPMDVEKGTKASLLKNGKKRSGKEEPTVVIENDDLKRSLLLDQKRSLLSSINEDTEIDKVGKQKQSVSS